MGQLEDIQIFVRVVEAGGIGKAAEQLNMAKSAVSRRLSELEARLETKLIHRTTRSSHLTEAGQFYYQRSLGLMASVEEMNQRLSDEDRHLEGGLRLSIPLSFGLQHLSPLLDEFARRYPKIKLYIDFSDREIDLIEEGLDMAVRISDLKDSSVQARKIAPIRFVLVASPGYLEAHGEPKDLQSLKHHQLLKYGNDELNSWRLEDEQGQKHDISFASRIHANNGEFL
ncbi:MAG: LysR family transcriptional regulator, partial [Hydrogenovibrio sp.]|nr:LysR family transcriptional regulator [Hydrogenovibrio sp.]